MQTDTEFNAYLNDLIEKYPNKISKLWNSARISERMFQYIKNGLTPSKETLLAIAVSIALDVDGIQNLLRKAGYILSKSLPNDIVVLWTLETVKFNEDENRLQVINDILYDLELPLLMTRMKK